MAGGMYAGITQIPGDIDGEWIKGEKDMQCPACKEGNLFFYWQGKYYHAKCEKCGYLYDTGRKMTLAEQKEYKNALKNIKILLRNSN